MVGNQIKFDDQVVARFLTNIYKQRFNIDSDIEAEMFRATRRIMADAMATGIADAVDNGTPMPSETFLNNLRHSAEVFSAFRVHKMQTDVASQMVDANGKLKSFAQFRKDVEPYVSHRNRAWLRTEYDTAVIRAHQATDWQQFESEKDVFPNLEWIPSTSPHPGADHQVFWGTVRPVNDSFWSEHRPGDRWNCKCELRQTEADATIPPMPTDADNPQPGLENNPGRDGELFSQKHPYYPSGCMSCPFAGGHLAALMHGLAHKQNCHQCEKVNKVIDKVKGYSGITAQLEQMQNAEGKEFSDILHSIINRKEFKPIKKNPGIYSAIDDKDPDYKPILKATQKLIRFEDKIFIMPNPAGIRTPDIICVRKNSVRAYDIKTITGKSSVINRLIESIGQTNRVVLNMGVEYNSRKLYREIKEYFQKSADAQEVIILVGKRKMSVRRNMPIIGKFIMEYGKKK